MNGYHIGLLIEQERNRKKISRKQLAAGIFSQQMLSKLENDQCESDMLQVEMLLQRLGRSPDKLEVFMPLSEYKKIKMRDLIEDMILSHKPQKAKYLLERYKDAFCENSSVHQMYYNRTMAYMLIRNDGSLDEALEYIIKALDNTLPGWQTNIISEYLISTYEMENMLAYGKLLYMLERSSEAQVHLKMCATYIESHYTDTEELAKIYPKCVWLLSKVCSDENDDSWITESCERALDTLRREAIGYFSTPVMEEIIWRYKRMGKEDRAVYWQRFYDTFMSLYEEYVPDMCQDSLFSNVYQRTYHLDYEMLRGERLAKGITQEELIADVYESAKSLSEVENHRKTATKKNYEIIMDKMGVDKRRYNGILATNSFDVLQKKNVYDYHTCVRDFERASMLLDELRGMLDIRIDDNRRFVEIQQLYLDWERGYISNDYTLEKAENILNETYCIEKMNNRTPTRNEVALINQIAICFERKAKSIEKAEWLGNTIDLLKKSKLDIKYNVRSYMVLMLNYIISLYNLGNYIKVEELTREAIISGLTYAKTRTLSHNCVIKSCIHINDEDKKMQCKYDIKRAYFIHEYNNETVNSTDVANFYEEVYGESILS